MKKSQLLKKMNKKGIAINTLGMIIMLLITMMVILYLIMRAHNAGSGVITDFFSFLRSS